MLTRSMARGKSIGMAENPSSHLQAFCSGKWVITANASNASKIAPNAHAIYKGTENYTIQ